MPDIKEFSPEHIKAANRIRRTVLQLDAINVIEENGTAVLKDNDRDPESFIERVFDFIDNIPNQVDSICWDFMYFGDEYSVYPSRILPRHKTGRLGKWASKNTDIFRLLVENGRKRGLENILVHRISETDFDLNDPAPHKKEHPEMYIKSWLYSGLHDLAFPEIRQRKGDILRECIENYPFDGLEIDFCRHTPFLEPGRQWELRENVTEFMRMLRATLCAIEKTSGRSLLLGARIPETLEGCRTDGIDVEKWAEECLVDSLTLGTRNFNVDIEDFRRITSGTGIKLFPCHDAHHTVDGYADPPIEIYRGVFANWWDRGADGIKLFNWFTASNNTYRKTSEGICTIDVNCQGNALSEAGDIEKLRKGDKTFAAERRGGYPWGEGFANHNAKKPLPMMLPNSGAERMLDMYICENIPQEYINIGSICIDLTVYGLNKEDRIGVKLNGCALDAEYDFNREDIQIQAPGKELVSGYHVRDLQPKSGRKLTGISCSPDPGIFIKGQNRLEFTLIRNSRYEYCACVTLEKAEITVRYKT